MASTIGGNPFNDIVKELTNYITRNKINKANLTDAQRSKLLSMLGAKFHNSDEGIDFRKNQILKMPQIEQAKGLAAIREATGLTAEEIQRSYEKNIKGIVPERQGQTAKEKGEMNLDKDQLVQFINTGRDQFGKPEFKLLNDVYWHFRNASKQFLALDEPTRDALLVAIATEAKLPLEEVIRKSNSVRGIDNEPKKLDLDHVEKHLNAKKTIDGWRDDQLLGSFKGSITNRSADLIAMSKEDVDKIPDRMSRATGIHPDEFRYLINQVRLDFDHVKTELMKFAKPYFDKDGMERPGKSPEEFLDQVKAMVLGSIDRSKDNAPRRSAQLENFSIPEREKIATEISKITKIPKEQLMAVLIPEKLDFRKLGEQVKSMAKTETQQQLVSRFAKEVSGKAEQLRDYMPHQRAEIARDIAEMSEGKMNPEKLVQIMDTALQSLYTNPKENLPGKDQVTIPDLAAAIKSIDDSYPNRDKVVTDLLKEYAGSAIANTPNATQDYIAATITDLAAGNKDMAANMAKAIQSSYADVQIAQGTFEKKEVAVEYRELNEAARENFVNVTVPGIIAKETAANPNPDPTRIANEIGKEMRQFARAGEDPNNLKGIASLSNKEVDKFAHDIAKATGDKVQAPTVKNAIILKLERTLNTNPEIAKKIAQKRTKGDDGDTGKKKTTPKDH
jgi:hypothetical protein